MFASIAAAAAENDMFVVGVDSDQSFDSETVITSALKGVGEAASWAIGKFYDGTWAEIANVGANLGAKDGATGIPTETWKLKNYTVEDYQAKLAAVIDGTLAIDADYANLTQTYSNLTLNVIE